MYIIIKIKLRFFLVSSSQSNLVSPTIVPIQRATATAFLPNNYCELAPDKGYPQEGTQPSSRYITIYNFSIIFRLFINLINLTKSDAKLTKLTKGSYDWKCQ